MKNGTMSEDTNYLLKCTVSFFPAASHTTFLSFFMLQYGKVKKKYRMLHAPITACPIKMFHVSVPQPSLPLSYLALWRGQQTCQVLCARLLVTMLNSTMVKKSSQGGMQTKGTAAFQQGLECPGVQTPCLVFKIVCVRVNLTAEYETLCRFYT